MSTIMLLDGSFVTCPKTCLYFGARFTAVLCYFLFFFVRKENPTKLSLVSPLFIACFMSRLICLQSLIGKKSKLTS